MAIPQSTFGDEEDEVIQQLMAFMLADLETLLLEDYANPVTSSVTMTRVEQDTTLFAFEQVSTSTIQDLTAHEPISDPVAEEAQLTHDHNVAEVVNSDEELMHESLAALQAYFVSEGFSQLESDFYYES
ncbi:hypothetical protein BC937DRAFT_95352 [Endogone sp. FLAS-F59071]|nr:hypothetical protein BC937DRAFT_95352 [Endogone sp. FLAS-F59071]|eukprot:RUS13427.1 hypothetical protein BC937DRAFT_95352 [Endogone sp. FLAS-F59071]